MDSTPGSPRGSVPALTQSERIRAGVVYWLFVGACLTLTAGGWYIVRLEDTPVRDAQRTPAMIQQVEVITRDDGHGHATKFPLSSTPIRLLACDILPIG
jgi:hypothetical protein